jgi:FkbM family methyltransferase
LIRIPSVSIYDYWPGIVETMDRGADQPCVVEVGVHRGDDSARLARVSPTGSLVWIGFEPDPRSVEFLRERGVAVIDKAASDTEGEFEFWLSSGWTPGQEGTRWHTDSSSLNRPTGHLKAAPWCRFDETIMVKTTRLDASVPARIVDLMWVDVQGAQRKVLAGARATLQRTRYIYIECHPTPMYEGEPSYEELCDLLPGFVAVKRWEAEALFRNSALTTVSPWRFRRATLTGLAASLARPLASIAGRIRRRRRS